MGRGWRQFVILMALMMTAMAQAEWKANEEDLQLAQKIVGLMSHKCAGAPNADAPFVANIAFLRGSPIDAINAPEAGERLMWLMNKIGEARHYNLQLQQVHHTNWQSVCDADKQAPGVTNIVIGHSYGASGAVKVAHCLEKEKLSVEGLLTLSSYDFLSGVDVTKIPANVSQNLNFYTNDASIPGYNNHKAVDPKQTEVRNILAKYSGQGWAHLNLPIKMVPLLALMAAHYVEHRPEQLQIPEQFDTENLADHLDQFQSCP